MQQPILTVDLISDHRNFTQKGVWIFQALEILSIWNIYNTVLYSKMFKQNQSR